MKDPNIFYIDNLLRHVNSCSAQIKAPDGKDVWVPARPLGFAALSERLRATWLVFTGKADALLWRGQ